MTKLQQQKLKRKLKQEKLLKRIIPILLTVPYFLGIIWTLLHPILSVVTGELKCRGKYIDENGLDVHRHRVESYPLQRGVLQQSSNNNNNVPVTMCQAIQSTTIPISSSVECLHHLATESISFDAVRILPPMGPMIDSTEAIVLVVGEEEYNYKSSNNKGWYERSDLNASIMHLIKKLGESPWLTKIVYIVSPSTTNVASVSDDANEINNASSKKDDRESYLVSVVDAFITSYLGDTSSTTKTVNNIRSLPTDYTSSMIRSVLVLNDIDTTTLSNMKKGGTEVNILPQGVGGSLPNLDLVFATYMSFGSHQAKTNGKRFDTSKSIYYGNDSVFRTHSFGCELEEEVTRVVKRLGDMIGLKSSTAEEYAKDLAGLLGFIGGLVIGPRQPHSSALNHGIDSLTIEVRIPNNGVGASSSSNIHPHYADLTRCMEHLLRSISNLHERLHHSVAQYTMPSPSKFVSHGEYIFPTILVSFPMVVRAAKLALRDLKRFHFVHVGMAVCAVCTSTLVISLWGYMSGWKVEGHTSQWTAMYFISYLVVVYAARLRDTQKEESETDLVDRRGSLRFISCLCGIYLHVPLLLANYSLGFPSSVFWTPLLAILILPDRFRAESKVILSLSLIVKCMLLLVTSPPILLVPRIFNFYTPYILCVYTPLHLLLAALWLA